MFLYAARLSCICPIITIVACALLMLGGQTLARPTIAAIASAALCLLVPGLVLAVVALLGISRHGTRGLRAPALVGLIANGLLISFVVASIVASRSGRTRPHGSIGSPAASTAGSRQAGVALMRCEFHHGARRARQPAFTS